MASNLRFDGKVVLVTGAGGGLGKAYALAFAERGAKVVVNDLGGGRHGDGASSRPAQLVVDEIKAKGGQAVANYDSVEDGEKVVQTALDNFGRIDIVINNAGILRDKSFARTSDQDWDLIHRVHLRGSFLVSRAAWPHMRKQNYGRIIMTSSAAGIYGNFGQANYSAAKLGILGLGNTLAIEGKKNNITCNTIAPLAGSRLTETVMPPDLVAALKPEYISPLVLWLSHASCEETGGLFEVGAGWAAKLRWQSSEGVMLRREGQPFTPETIRDNWEKITDFSNPMYPKTGDTTTRVFQLLQEADSGSPPAQPQKTSGKKSNIENAIGHTFDSTKFNYSERDVILYALGVGMSTREPDHLRFLFEMDQDFCVLPSFSVLASFSVINAPGLDIDPTQILHGEQYMRLFKPMPTCGTLTVKSTIADILDKGSGAVVLINVETFDDKGEKVSFNQFTIFVQKMGGFGGKRSSDKTYATESPPKRAPDASIVEKTSESQAALYRLSGDRNPLHIDPSFAAMGGFSTPILHGLCSFGYSVRHLLKQYCNNDVTKLKAVKVRFSKPVLPGQSLQTDMWKEGSRVFFQTKVAETGSVCLSGCYADLNIGDSPSAGAGPSQGGQDMKSDLVFAEIQNRVSKNPDLVKKIKASFLFKLTDGKNVVREWAVDLKNAPGSVMQGPPKAKADVTMTLSDENFVKLASGQLSGQQAFMSGKLKVQGNIMLSQKLGSLFQEQSKL